MTAYGIIGGSAAMWLAMGDPQTFENEYYGDPGSVSVTDLKIADMPRLEALMSLPHWTIKSWADGANGPRAYEGQFHKLWQRAEAGLACSVLRDSAERIYAVASISESDEGRVLDTVAHPLAAEAAVGLVQEVAGGESGLRAYVAETDELRRKLLEVAGFTLERHLDEPLDLGERNEPVTVWRMA